MRALDSCLPAPVEVQAVLVAELSGGQGLKHPLCSRELAALRCVVQGTGRTVPTAQRGVAAQWDPGTLHTWV